MTYQSMANLSKDQLFHDRVEECCLEQANQYKDDADYSNKQLANALIGGATSHSDQLFQLVIATPNFKNIDDATGVEDIEILSAVQYVWPIYATVVFPNPNPPAE